MTRLCYDPTDETLPEGGGLPNHRKHIKEIPVVLDVVAVVSNPLRYRSRYDLYRAFERHMQDSGVRLTTVECAFGERPFEVTEANNPRHLQVRSSHTIWLKECLINMGIQILPRDWKYVAWIDADLTFLRPDWAQETLHALQHWAIVQPFSHSLNLGPRSEPIFDTHRVGEAEQRKKVVSWLYAHHNQLPRDNAESVKPPAKCCCCGCVSDGNGQGCGCGDGSSMKAAGQYVWHSGFAWAARREAIETIGGLLDWAILGSADRHMADMMTGVRRWNPKLSPGYRHMLVQKHKLFDKLNDSFGWVDGLVAHHYHGRLVDRQYQDRWKILFAHQFDPLSDLRRDSQGLWQLTDEKPGLREDVHRYFAARHEDETAV